MDKGQPWSVKGIDPETRQAAKMAARRAGLTVGAWLNAVIQRAAAEDLGMPAPQAAPQPGYPPTMPAPAMTGQNMTGQNMTAQGMPGQAIPGYTIPGHLPGHAMPGHAVPGQAIAGQVYPGQAIQGQQPPLDAQMPSLALETLLEALRRQTEEVKATIRSSAEELRYNTEKIAPMAERLRPMGDRLDAIAARLEQTGEVDARLTEAERKAERAALQVTPLERTLTRLFERMEGEDQMPYEDSDGRYRRRGLFGKLFGN